MKELKDEFQMFIAEKLLAWAFYFAPKTKDGDILKKHIAHYIFKIQE
jgi:hypothetical protein